MNRLEAKIQGVKDGKLFSSVITRKFDGNDIDSLRCHLIDVAQELAAKTDENTRGIKIEIY